MKNALIRSFLTLAIVVMVTSVASAATTTITAYPSQVPDEQPPRVNVGDFPTGYDVDSWQGPVAGAGNKTNWHARYIDDGDYLSDLFPAEAATMTVADLAEVAYSTKRPTGLGAGEDWWVQIYTRPTGSGDKASWYHDRFINNYASHTALDTWEKYSTSTGMTFQSNGWGGPVMTLAEFITNHGSEEIMMFSVQTNSGWNGFDGYIDGLEVTLTNGSIGNVNFEDEPQVPASGFWGILALSLAIASVLVLVVRRRFQTA